MRVFQAVLLSLAVTGIKCDNQRSVIVETPSEAPYSLFPSSEAPSYNTYLGEPCPDKHVDILPRLEEAFGADNCEVEVDPDGYGNVVCTATTSKAEIVTTYYHKGDETGGVVFDYNGKETHYIDFLMPLFNAGFTNPNTEILPDGVGTCMDAFDGILDNIERDRIAPPSEAPQSLFPSSEAPSVPSYLTKACPDTTSSILEALYSTFGGANCAVKNNDRSYTDLECTSESTGVTVNYYYVGSTPYAIEVATAGRDFYYIELELPMFNSQNFELEILPGGVGYCIDAFDFIFDSVKNDSCDQNQCYDNHSTIFETLKGRFGDDNCNINDSTSGEITVSCEYSVPYWFSAFVIYKAEDCSSDDEPYYTPTYIEASYQTPPGSSWEDTDLKENCLSRNNIFTAMNQAWVDKDDAPPIPSDAPFTAPDTDAPAPDDECGFTSYPFESPNGLTHTCADVAGMRMKERVKKCKKPEFASNCPGLCNKEQCSCSDNPFTFPVSKVKSLSCDALLNERKLKNKCKKKKYWKNCPTVCDPECGAAFG